MKYQIICDRPGRLRVRMGKYAFTKEQGYGIENCLAAMPEVLSASASFVNGGILVTYKGNARKQVLELLKGFTRSSLPSGTRSDETKRKENKEHFAGQVTDLVMRHYVKKWFFPAPLRLAFTSWHAAQFIFRGARSLARGKVNVEVLDAASIICAFAQGTPDTAGSVMLLLRISDCLEEYTKQQTKDALAESLAFQTDKVWLVTDQGDVRVPMKSIHQGDHIRVQAGSIIPIDGRVAAGDAMVNEASLTGEAMAVLRKEGHSVYAGTVIEEGNIEIEVTCKPDQSRIYDIVRMIDESEDLKAGVQGRAERMADRFVPFSFLTAGIAYLLTGNMVKATSVLMVDYSCALKLSIPISVISAMREGVDHRILIKGGKFLENFAQADTIIFDKTGTLTSASPKVAKVLALGDYTREKVLRDAACLEEHFPHSVARAIVNQAAEENLKHREEHAKVEYVVAHGISTILRDQKAKIGSAHFIFEDEHVPKTADAARLEQEEMQGLSVIYLAVDGKLVGMIGIDDPVRGESKEMIQNLRDVGFKHIIMMTGDNEASAKRAAESLGITEYFAQVLPEDKADKVKEVKKNGSKVVMVGDGINDSPALAAADVSVAMKDSSDLAREVADVTLMTENLKDLLLLRELSEKLMKRISRNVGFIMSFNTLLMALGLFGVVPPSTTSLLHNLSTMGISVLSTRPYLKEDQENLGTFLEETEENVIDVAEVCVETAAEL